MHNPEPKNSITLFHTRLTKIHRGLGALICDKFAAEGCNIAVNYNASKDAADRLGEEIKSKYGVKAISLAGVGVARLLDWKCEPLRRQ